MKRRIVFGALALLWLGFIFYNSLQTAEVSGGMSEGLLHWFGLPDTLETLLRKSAHFFAFMALGLLISGALTRLNFPTPLILLLVLMCACTDETLQLFSEGRSSELRDVWIDLSGGTLGTLAAALFYKFKKKKQKITIEKESTIVYNNK